MGEDQSKSDSETGERGEAENLAYLGGKDLYAERRALSSLSFVTSRLNS